MLTSVSGTSSPASTKRQAALSGSTHPLSPATVTCCSSFSKHQPGATIKRLNQRSINVYRMRDGKIAEDWVFAEDGAALDSFLS